MEKLGRKEKTNFFSHHASRGGSEKREWGDIRMDGPLISRENQEHLPGAVWYQKGNSYKRAQSGVF